MLGDEWMARGGVVVCDLECDGANAKKEMEWTPNWRTKGRARERGEERY